MGDARPIRDAHRHLHSVCPTVIKLHAMDDLGRREAAGSSLAARIGGAPDLEPLADFLRSKKARGCAAASSLRALGEGGWWTQERLHREGAGGVEDLFCRACGPGAAQGVAAAQGPATGTIAHRCCG